MRLEVRVRHGVAEDLEKGVAHAQALMEELLGLVGQSIHIQKVPVTEHCQFLRLEVAAAVEKATFKGMGDNGPNNEDAAEVERFSQKQTQLACLVSNMGLYPGHFGRRLANGSSCQDRPKRALTW